MNIVIKESGKRFTLKLMNWDGYTWVALNAEDWLVNGSFHYDHDLEAWVFSGKEEDLRDWLLDWENYNTDDDIQALSDEEREEARYKYQRYFELTEVEG